MPDGKDDDARPLDSPPTPSEKPPLLDYPSPSVDPELDSEPWPQVARAMLIVFGVLLSLFFLFFGVCGIMSRGCG